MDPLTHMLVGAALADSCSAPGRMGRGALPYAMALAAAPDLDVVPALVAAFPSNPFSSALFDSGMMLALHRGWTHALPVLAVVSIAAGLIAWPASGGKGARRDWIVLAALALITHSLLDMINGAVRTWLPFSREWIGWSQAPEADPLLLAVLLTCFLTNHPPRFRNARGLGTLAALEGVGKWFSGAIGGRIAAKPLAILSLALITLVEIFRVGF